MTDITDVQLEQWAAHAEPISRSSVTASAESKFSVMGLASHVVRLVDEVRRLRRSEAPETTHLVASLSPATDPHEPEDARDGEEDHRGDREPQVAVRSTGEHQDSAEGDRDDRDCETDPPEHRLQAAYPHRSTLADARTAVERVDLGVRQGRKDFRRANSARQDFSASAELTSPAIQAVRTCCNAPSL